MSQIESIYSPQVEKQLQQIYSELEKHQKKVLEISKMSVDFYGGKTASKPADLSKTELQVKRLQQQYERLRQSEERLVLSAGRLDKAKDREMQKLVASQNLYNKTQQQLNRVQQVYNELAVKKERYNNLTSFEERRLKTLQAVTERYNTTLKAVDVTVGKHTRNVGNYASGFNPISNSINQLTREMPAFTYSVQTGFMALSNNIPIFTDAVGNAVRQNKELIAQGQPVKSVLMQVAGAFFSWQTLMGVGITLLTVYGKEIGEFIKGALAGSKALNVLTESTKQINEARIEGIKSAQNELAELKVLLGVAKDETKSKQQRLLAVKELQETYPDYLGNLSKEEILAGKVEQAEKNLTNALLSRAKAQAATTKITENQSKIIDLEEESLKVKEDIAKQTVINDRIQQQTANRLLNSTREEDYALARSRTESDKLAGSKRELADINSEIAKLNEINNRLTSYAIENTVLFNDKERETNKVLKDIIASEYELRKAILERKKAQFEDVKNNEDLFLDERLKASEDYYNTLRELEDLELKNNLYNAKLKRDNDLKDAKDKAEVIKQYEYDIRQAYVESSTKSNEIANQEIAFRRKIEEEKRKFIEATLKLETDDRKKRLENVFKNENENLEKRKEAFREYILLLKTEADASKIREIANATSEEQLDNIEEKYKGINKELDLMNTMTLEMGQLMKEAFGYTDIIGRQFKGFRENLTKEQLKMFDEILEGYNLAMEMGDQEMAKYYQKQLEQLKGIAGEYKQLFDSFTSDFTNQSGFGKFFDLLNNDMEQFKGNAKATALVVSEAFQEAFNTISNANQQNFDFERELNEERYALALKFANGNAEAEENLLREKERREKEIARREAQARKKIALFNIAIDGAQAITATLGKTGFAGIPLTAIVATLIGAQLALVASQEIPEFWKGTDNAPEGWAKTDERGAEIHTDSKGNIKDFGTNKGTRVKYLEKGDKIINANKTKELLSLANFNKEYNDLLFRNQILPPVVMNNSNNVDLSGVESKLDKLVNKSELTIIDDENGRRYYEKKQNATMELKNSRIYLKSRNVRG